MIMMIMRTIGVMILMMKNIKDNAKTIIMVNNNKHVYKIDLKQYKNHKTCVKVGKKHAGEKHPNQRRLKTKKSC